MTVNKSKATIMTVGTATMHPVIAAIIRECEASVGSTAVLLRFSEDKT